MSLYHEVHGSPVGRDLVLLHGWSVNLGIWDTVVPLLVPYFRVITIDLPGHGRSPWDPKSLTPAAQAWRVHETLASLTERCTLLGWSLGGQVAIDLAAALPSGIERLVLVAVTPKFLEAPGWRCGTPRPLLARLTHQLHAESARAVSGFLTLAARGSAPQTAHRTRVRLERALITHGWPRAEALTAGLARLRDGDLRPALPLVRMPVLAVAGRHDRFIRRAAVRRLARALPEGRYVEIAGAGHAPFLSNPRVFTRLLREFVRD